MGLVPRAISQLTGYVIGFGEKWIWVEVVIDMEVSDRSGGSVRTQIVHILSLCRHFTFLKDTWFS